MSAYYFSLDFAAGGVLRDQLTSRQKALLVILSALGGPSVVSEIRQLFLVDGQATLRSESICKQLHWMGADGAPSNPPITGLLGTAEDPFDALTQVYKLDLFASGSVNYATNDARRKMIFAAAGLTSADAAAMAEAAEISKNDADYGAPSVSAEFGSPALARGIGVALTAARGVAARLATKGAGIAGRYGGVGKIARTGMGWAAGGAIAGLAEGAVSEYVSESAKAVGSQLKTIVSKWRLVDQEANGAAGFYVMNVLPRVIAASKEDDAALVGLLSAGEAAVEEVLSGETGSPDSFANAAMGEWGAPASMSDDEVISFWEAETGCPCSNPEFGASIHAAMGSQAIEGGSPAHEATYRRQIAIMRANGAKMRGFPSESRFARKSDRRQKKIIARVWAAAKRANRRLAMLQELAQRPALRAVMQAVISAGGKAASTYVGAAGPLAASATNEALDIAVQRSRHRRRIPERGAPDDYDDDDGDYDDDDLEIGSLDEYIEDEYGD